MSKSILIAIVATLSAVAAPSWAADLLPQGPSSVQVASQQTQGVMTHQVATLMQMKREADAQYRRTGRSADQAYARALDQELASRGWGRSTTTAPVPGAQDVLLAGSLAAQATRVN